MKVQWADLYTDQEEFRAIMGVVKSGMYSQGKKVLEFEKMMAEIVDSKYAIAVNNGTSALDAALKALDVGPGDEVIVPAFSYIASANCILYQDATPVFCDVDPKTFTLDAKEVARKITKKTKCIIPVDYAGQGPDYREIKKLARAAGVPILEDAAPGLGGKYRGKGLCSQGTISITSFHAAKVMSTVEGGMIFTDSEKHLKNLRIIRSQGEDPEQKYHHPLVGHNFRMTELQAAMGIVQAKRLPKLLKKRAEIAEFYFEALANCDKITLPFVHPDNEHAWFLYPLLIPNRDKVRAKLTEKGIQTNVSWPMPIYRQKPYLRFKAEVCPVSEHICKHVLCLPMFYSMTLAQQEFVVDQLLKALK